MKVKGHKDLLDHEKSNGEKVSHLHGKIDTLLQPAVSGGVMGKFVIICKFAQRMKLFHFFCNSLCCWLTARNFFLD